MALGRFYIPGSEADSIRSGSWLERCECPVKSEWMSMDGAFVAIDEVESTSVVAMAEWRVLWLGKINEDDDTRL